MITFIRKLTSSRRILYIGIILILIPLIVISFLSLRSLNQKAENLRIKYDGTAALIKDKLESQIQQSVAYLNNNFIELIPAAENKVDLQQWLDSIMLNNPVFTNLVIHHKNGGLLSNELSWSWPDIAISSNPANLNSIEDFQQAERSEFISRNYKLAVNQYKKALEKVSDDQSKAVLHSRIGRCYLNSGDIFKSLESFNEILDLGNPFIMVGSIPAKVAALFQIADAYESGGMEKEKKQANISLYKQILDTPWDLNNGEYLFYLKSTSEKVASFSFLDSDTTLLSFVDSLNIKQKKILEEAEYISDLAKRINNQADNSKNTIHLPSAFESSILNSLSYNFDSDYIICELFPGLIKDIELGKDVIVGILNSKDSLMYSEEIISGPDYLASEPFTNFFKEWRVAIFDSKGKSIERLIGNEKTLYLILFLGIFIVTVTGIIILFRALNNETKINKMKAEFISNVSHELKTPLALIRMFGETLESGIVKDENKQKEFYSIIRKESERLTHLVNNVLDFSKLDTGTKKYNMMEEDLVSVVRTSLEAYKFHIKDMGFEIESDFPKNPLYLEIDRDAFSQALLNLLSNSVKYSDTNKYIKVSILKNKDTAELIVQDKGIGIPGDELENIFEKFYQVSSGVGKENRGSGLGLSITKQIIEAHNGKIEVKSEKGQGCTFTIKLPISG